MRQDTPVMMLAVIFNAAASTIDDIVRGKSYKNVGGQIYPERYSHHVDWAPPRKKA